MLIKVAFPQQKCHFFRYKKTIRMYFVRSDILYAKVS